MKPQIYLAKSSKLMPEARAWMARIREAGFRVYDWTKDPGWADPTEENRRIGALNDLHEVVKASVFWWHCDNEISEGAAIEFGYALVVQQVIPKEKRFVLAVSGPRAGVSKASAASFFDVRETLGDGPEKNSSRCVEALSARPRKRGFGGDGRLLVGGASSNRGSSRKGGRKQQAERTF